MAVEGLVLVHPTDSQKNITLNGSKWALEELDLGNPARRDELVASVDASGAVPFRVAPRDNREVNARLRLIDPTTMDAAMDSIAALEALLETAERLASLDPSDPVTDLVRLVYTPADSTRSFSLIVYTGEITGIPRTVSGEDAGFFIKRPVVTIKCSCDPFAYGAGVSSPTRTTWLDTTVSGGTPDSKTVPASGSIAGDVAPFARVRLKDEQGQVRNRIVIGAKKGEAAVTPTIAAGSLTAISGTVTSGVMSTSSTDWTVAGQLPRQTRAGTFRIVLAGATSTTSGSVRFVSAPAGSSKRSGPPAGVAAGTTSDVDLGEVAIDSAWDGWIETTGSVKFSDVVIVPTDSFVDVTGASPGRQLVGAVAIADTLRTTSTSINGRSFTTGSGTWSNTSGSWPVSSTNWARRTALSMTDPVFAFAGTGNYLDADVRARIRRTGSNVGFTGRLSGLGVILRYNTTGAYLAFVYSNFLKRFTLAKVFGSNPGDEVILFTADHTDSLGFSYDLQVQTTLDGRWYAAIRNVDGPALFLEGSGQDNDLVVPGGSLGNPTAAQVGLFDFHDGVGSVSRDISNFQVSPLTGVTPPPIPANSQLTLVGPKLLTADNSEHPYTGSSGIRLEPGASNNLTTIVRPATAQALGLTVDGWPRYLSVPHG